jgi:hypothetical protein
MRSQSLSLPNMISMRAAFVATLIVLDLLAT